MDISKTELLKEISFKTSRSGGKGGQNVNKVATKVELNLDIDASGLFNAEQKQQLKDKLKNRVNSEGILQVISEEERSQLLNKEVSIAKLLRLLSMALHKPKLRRATKPKKSSVEKRLKSKQLQSLKKISRRSDFGL